MIAREIPLAILAYLHSEDYLHTPKIQHPLSLHIESSHWLNLQLSLLIGHTLSTLQQFSWQLIGQQMC